MFDKQEIIPIACDHGGFEMKQYLLTKLSTLGYVLKDMGTHSAESVDYPDLIHPLAKAVNSGNRSFKIMRHGVDKGVKFLIDFLEFSLGLFAFGDV